MILKLTNNLTKSETTYSNLKVSSSRTFYEFEIQLGNMEDGEYSYELADDDIVLATGLLQIGDYKPQGQTTYNNQDKGYITYAG